MPANHRGLLLQPLHHIIIQPLLSMPRRLSLIFPLYTQLARWSTRSSLRLAWLGLSAATMLGLAAAFCYDQFIP